jgi:CheY-like chemotaxis protein
MPVLTSVLLVNDDSTTNYLNKLLLMRMGVAEQVFVTEPTTCPRLILLDMNMPVLNGLAFLEAYAQLPLAWWNIPQTSAH